MDYDALKAQVVRVIKPNNNKEITGQVLQDVLTSMIEAGKQDNETLTNETAARTDAISSLQDNLNAEVTRAKQAEQTEADTRERRDNEVVQAATTMVNTVQGNLDEVETDLQSSIDAESVRAKQAESDLQNQIDGGGSSTITGINTNDSGDVQNFLPSSIQLNTRDSGLPYVDNSVVGSLDSLDASSYGLMTKAISVVRGQTISSNLSGVYIYEVPTTLSRGAYVRLLTKSNTWYATKDCKVSFLIFPTDGQEATLSRRLLNSRCTITTSSLKTQVWRETADRQNADNELRKMITGSKTALSYNSYQEMIAAINAMGSSSLALGQQIFIKVNGKINSWVAGINTTKMEYGYFDDAAVESALKSDAGLTIGYYTLLPLTEGSIDLSEYYNKTEIDNKQAVLQKGIDDNGTDIANLQQAVNGDTVVSVKTMDTYYAGLLNFVPADASAERSYLTAMGGGNMAGSIALTKGEEIKTIERSDITVYRVYRNGDNKIAERCTIEKLGTGDYTATEDMEVLLYDTKGWSLHTAESSGTFLTYTLTTTTVSLNARVEALETGRISATAVADTTDYTDITSSLTA